MVFLHGRGDTAEKLSSILLRTPTKDGTTLGDALPTIKWVFPQAPTRACAADPAVRWPQWFDVWNVRDFREREELQAEGLREVVPQVQRILAAEAAALGGDWGRVVLGGISMGAATSVHVLFNMLDTPPLGAFMGFCCRCPFAGRDLKGMRRALGLVTATAQHDGVLRRTPMLLEHCVDDPLVPVEMGRGLRDILRGFGAAVKWIEYPEGGHWFQSPDGMEDVLYFLSRHLKK